MFRITSYSPPYSIYNECVAHFSYTAEKAGGEQYSGVAEAKDRFELYQIVRREGGKVLTVTEGSEGGVFNLSYWNARLTPINEYDKILFARNLGAMLSAGLSLSRALSVLERQTKNPHLTLVITEVSSAVRRGDALHVALAKFPGVFSRLFSSMVRAGEEGGDLQGALSVVADQMERMFQIKKKIKSAMIYPAIIVVAIVGIAILMMIKVVPTLAQTFAEVHATLPSSTQAIISISNFLVHYTALALGSIAAVVLGVYAFLRTDIGKKGSQFVFLHLPGVNELIREVNAARTARTLSSLLSSGVDVLSSLEITGEVVQNFYFRSVLQDATRRVKQGEPLSAAFAQRTDLYPAFVSEMMSVGEETGTSADMLKRLAIFYEDEVDRKTKDMSTIVEPFLMVFIGGSVGFFAVSMITPIYQLSQNF